MTPREIKAKLEEKNVRQIDLVKKWKLPSSTVSLFINRKLKSARLDKRLARILEVPVEALRGE